MPSKTEEIEIYRSFVAGLPNNSYLADLLAGTVELIEQQIRSDVAMPLGLAELWAHRREADDQLTDARRLLNEARAELAKVEQKAKWTKDDAARTVAQANADLAKLHETARRVANTFAHAY